jgi:hypothetical protein
MKKMHKYGENRASNSALYGAVRFRARCNTHGWPQLLNFLLIRSQAALTMPAGTSSN